ncbi:MAG: type II toxin-antitoxin system HipA family toxin [Roseburia sp.]|nr:type II toxin-antitoxin system HipA family toxin [Roseburia sp.]MCM1097650.1 type II toxin-antitoxin system HipA family toxin [Ruminococcus flavefaciens]
MNKVKQLSVLYHGKKVGTLALYRNQLAAFEYTAEWLAEGFAISPFSLPLEKKVFLPKPDPYDGVFGVFADSLPDGWGRLLVDRLMLKNHMDPHALGSLDRLAIVGDSGMGALTFEPEADLEYEASDMSLDAIAEECRRLLETKESEKLDDLFAMGGSSGGARPKILTLINGEHWIIKFPSAYDGDEAGRQEYEYSQCAKDCGILMEPTALFSSQKCGGYFGTRRFDRSQEEAGENRIHMISAAALLETSHRIPNLDYDILMRLTLALTRDIAECEKLFRLMCFNVFAHNRDDHSRNFSYLYLEKENRWILSPAYDLTYSNSLGGEHATTVHSNGVNPDMADILAVAKEIGIGSKRAKQIASQIQECVADRLSEFIRNR